MKILCNLFCTHNHWNSDKSNSQEWVLIKKSNTFWSCMIGLSTSSLLLIYSVGQHSDDIQGGQKLLIDFKEVIIFSFRYYISINDSKFTQTYKPKRVDVIEYSSFTLPPYSIHSWWSNLYWFTSKTFESHLCIFSLPYPVLIRANIISCLGYDHVFLTTLCSTIIPLHYNQPIFRRIF